MRRSFRRNRKAVSPVIATIIIVAIAIVMAIAVAYWVLGLGATFTKYEKVAFISAYATGTETTGYTITMSLKNTGTATATFDTSTVFYNGKPASAYLVADRPVAAFTPMTLEPGKATTAASITMAAGTDWTSGMTVEVTIQTTSGDQYPKAIVLP